MDTSEEFKTFLQKEQLQDKELKKAGLSEKVLLEIFLDYQKNVSLFMNEAEKIKKKLLTFKGIHSVKTRIKDKYELIRKVVKKSSKQSPITKENYLYKITDIIGARILYLFKTDYLQIHNQIVDEYEKDFTENVQINVLTGGVRDFKGDIKGFIKENNFYSSIHYIMKTKTNPETRIELQTRTIFEEGVGEISHFANYKSEISSPLLESAVKILVRNVELCNEIAELIKALNNANQKGINKEEIETIERKLIQHFQITSKK